MDDKRLLKYVRAFRRGLLGKRPSNWACAMVCITLAPLLEMQGVRVALVETDLGEMNHVWLRLSDGRALDPTADQFNELFSWSLPPVYLGAPLTIHGAAPEGER